MYRPAPLRLLCTLHTKFPAVSRGIIARSESGRGPGRKNWIPGPRPDKFPPLGGENPDTDRQDRDLAFTPNIRGPSRDYVVRVQGPTE